MRGTRGWAKLLLSCLGAIFLLVSPRTTAAQTTATISGTVSDSSGAVVPGAQVTVTNLDTGQIRTLKTNDAGLYYVPALNPGSYKITVSAKGFQEVIRSGITLTVGREEVIDFALRPGAVTQKVEVTGATPGVQTTSASIAELVDSQTVRALPLNGRSYDRLILLQPGVNLATSAGNSPNQGRGMKFSVAGARLTSNLFMLDGTDINDSQNFTPGGVGGQLGGVLLGVESIREFQLVTHNASAQYGRSMGGIINAVSKSGANFLHGGAYEFLRNSALDAKNFFDNPALPIPHLSRNQFGASLGGPIRRDRWFFFGNYEGLRESFGVTKNGFVPDANARAGIIPGNPPIAVNSAVSPYLALYPSPNGPEVLGAGGAATGVARLQFSQKQPTRGDYVNGRVDWNRSDKDSFFFRYTLDDSKEIRQDNPNQVLGLFAENEPHRNQYATLSSTHLFSARVLNIARFGFNRSRTQVDIVNQANVPAALSFIPGEPFGTLQVGGVSPLGNDVNDPRYFRMNSFQPSDDLSITRGAHALSLGGVVERFQWNTAAFNRIGGNYVFVDLPSFLRAQVQSVVTPFPGSDPIRGIRALLVGTYVQDDYRLTHRLTLNLGLRYEVTTVPTEAFGRLSFLLDPSDTSLAHQQPFAGNHRDFAPRIGFAWNPKGDGKTALRGGWGIYYDQILLNQFLNMFDRNPPQWLTVTLTGNNAPFPNPLSAAVLKPQFSLQNMVFNNSKTPYSSQYNFTVQREIAPQLVVSIAYAGSTARHIVQRYDGNTPIPLVCPNPSCPASLPAGTLFTPAGSPRRNSAWGAEQTRPLTGLSYYNALEVLVTRRFVGGLQVQGAYTYSKSMDSSGGLFSEEADNAATGVEIPDRISNDLGLSNFDIRHRGVINFLYRLPFGKNLKGFSKGVLGGWELGSIATISTGVPFTVENSANRSRNLAVASDFSDRPNLLPGVTNNPTHGISLGCPGFATGTPLGTPDLFFDPCAFAPQLLGTFGNLGRNTLIGPGLTDVDFLLGKEFRISEGKELQFRAEFFNLLNHPNFEAPTTAAGTRRIFPGGPNPAPLAIAGKLTNTPPGTTPRQIQFGLKFVF